MIVQGILSTLPSPGRPAFFPSPHLALLDLKLVKAFRIQLSPRKFSLGTQFSILHSHLYLGPSISLLPFFLPSLPAPALSVAVHSHTRIAGSR
jgi:hypothetical protein